MVRLGALAQVIDLRSRIFVKGRGIIPGRSNTGSAKALPRTRSRATPTITGSRAATRFWAKARKRGFRLSAGRISGLRSTAPERLELARRVMEWQALPENQGQQDAQAGARLPACVAVVGARLSAEPRRDVAGRNGVFDGRRA